MLKFLFVLVNVFLALCAYAQDVIVKKNGEVLNVYNVEIATKYIYYTTNKSTDDIKKIIKDDVFSVKIGNGEMQMIGDKTKEQPKIQENTSEKEKLSEGLVERKVADNNAELIARYNKYHNGYTDKKPTDKVAKDGYAILGVTKESVLSNEDIEIELKMRCYNRYRRNGDWRMAGGMFNVNIINKTDKIVYVDLGNTFKIYNNGNAKVYYDGSQVSQNTGSSSGSSLNLGAVTGALGIGGIVGTLAGGVNVGGGSQNSVSKTYGSQRVFAIPPLGKVNLPPYYEIINKEAFDFYTGKKTNMLELYDNIWIVYPEKDKAIMRKYAVTDFNEEETPWKNQFMVTYSLDSAFKTYSTMKFCLYLRQIIGKHRTYDIKKIQNYDDYSLIGVIGLDKKAQLFLDVKKQKWTLTNSDYTYY